MSSSYLLTCLLCGDDAQPSLEDHLVAYQEHALVEHGVTREDLAQVSRTQPLSDATVVYIYTLPDGRPWLRAEKLRGLVHSGMLRGYKPHQLAEALDLSIDLLALLDASAIAVESLPEALLRQLAEVLGVSEALLRAYLAAEVKPPTFPHTREWQVRAKPTFQEAVKGSVMLTPEPRQHWLGLTS
jgi:hypothetical protein